MISPQLNLSLAHDKALGLRRAAPQAFAQPRPAVARENVVTLRLGADGDEGPLARLAALDSSVPLAQPVLLADVDGHPVAALALTDGAVVADPFRPTAELVQLLRTRAHQLNGSTRIPRRWRLRSWPRIRAVSQRSR